MTASYQSEAWQKCHKHREKITNDLLYLANLANGTGSLCVWGAGPCNDLDLEKLLTRFATITLVDLEGSVLEEAVKRRGLDRSSRIYLQKDVDLAGLVEAPMPLAADMDQKSFDQLLERISKWAPEHSGTYDVVASTCLMSQIFEPVIQALESGTERMLTLLRALRKRHLELIAGSLAPSGNALLVTDVTSSDAIPELKSPNVDLKQILHEQVFAGEHFHCLNPRAIEREISNNPTVQARLNRHLVSQPWIWDATKRQYLCVSFLLQAKSAFQ